jgi:hypothetical protein
MVHNPTLNYLNGVHSYYHQDTDQSQQASNGSNHGASNWIPNVQVPVVIPNLIGGGGGNGNGYNVNVIATDPRMLQEIRHQQQEDQEQSRATTAAVVGGIGTIVFAALGALALRGYCNDREELKKAYEFKNDILPHLDRQLILQVTPIVNEHIDILEAKTGRARNILFLTGFAALDVIAAFVAGMLAIQWVITACIVAGVALAAIGVFLLVWHCTEKSTLSDQMQQDVERLRAHLSQQQPLNSLDALQNPLVTAQDPTALVSSN